MIPYALHIQQRTGVGSINTNLEGKQVTDSSTNANQSTTVQNLLTGRALSAKDPASIQSPSKIVRIFLSSTFTDTRHERDLFNIWMVPQLKRLCAEHGMEFQQSEMRWGIDDKMGQSHQTSAICMSELRRCLRDSASINFIGFLFDKYGYRPFPCVIEKNVFEAIRDEVVGAGESTELIDQWFALDSNSHASTNGAYLLSPVTEKYPDYILEATTDEEKARKKAAQDSWWKDFEAMQLTLRRGAIAAQAKGTVDDKTANLFVQSVTAEEMSIGITDQATVNNKAPRAVLVLREMQGIDTNNDAAKSFIDTNDNAQELLKELKTTLSAKILGENMVTLDPTHWDGKTKDGFDPLTNDEHAKSLNQLMARLWGILSKRIVEVAQQRAGTPRDELVEEIRQHVLFAHAKTRMFAAREDVMSQVRAALAACPVTVVHGVSGTGKTSIIAKVLQEVATKETSTAVALRFLGTSPESSTSAGVMRSVMSQIRRVYGADVGDLAVPDPAASDTELQPLFAKYLAVPKSAHPLFLALDSLDQLRQGRNLQWLPLKLKEKGPLRLLLSTLPQDASQDCLSILRRHVFVPKPKQKAAAAAAKPPAQAAKKKKGGLCSCFSSSSSSTVSPNAGSSAAAPAVVAAASAPPLDAFVEVKPLSKQDVSTIFDGWLKAQNRQLTETQFGFIDNHFSQVAAQHQTPLFLWLLFNTSCSWKSWTDAGKAMATPPSSTQDAVMRVLEEVETTCSAPMTRHALALITASRDGLSEDELADLLSCNDDVLDAIFEWWLPPVIRIPPLMVTRLVSSLSDFLVSRGTSSKGAPLLGWYHRQFWEAAEVRYLDSEEKRRQIHLELATYFEGKWANGKPYAAKGKFGQFKDQPTDPNRQISAQPLELTLVSGSAPNTRRLRERVHHLLKANNWDAAIAELVEIGNFYVATKLKTGMFADVVEEVGQCLQGIGNHPRRSEVVELKRFLLLNKDILTDCPQHFFDQAANAPSATKICERGLRHLCDTRANFWKCVNTREDYNAVMMNLSHSDDVRGCAYSPNGNLIATVSGKSLRIWGASTGLLLQQIDHADNLITCTFAQNGSLLATGGHDGILRVWDALTGSLIRTFQGHTDYIFSCAFSPNCKFICSGGDDASAIVWDVATGNLVRRINTGGRVSSCAFSPDGTALAVIFKARIWFHNTTNFQRTNEIEGFDDRLSVFTGIAYSPSGTHVAVSSRDHTLSVYHVASKHTEHRLHGHGHIVHSVAYSPDGNLLASVGEDLRVKVWDTKSGKEIRTFEHTREVLCCAFSPDGTELLTGSKDRLAIVWELHKEPKKTTAKFGGMLGKLLGGGNKDEEPSVWERPQVRECILSPDGQVVAAIMGKNVVLWSTDGGAKLHTLKSDAEEAISLRFSDDSTQLITGGNKIAKIWDVSKGKLLHTLKAHKDLVIECAFSPDKSFAVTAGQEQVVVIWNAQKGKSLHKLKAQKLPVTYTAFTFDNQRLVTVCDESLMFWEPKKGKCQRALTDRPFRGRGCVMSSTKPRLAVGLLGGNTDIFDTNTMDVVVRFSVGTNPRLVSLYEPGQVLLAYTGPSVLKMFDIATGKEISSADPKAPANTIRTHKSVSGAIVIATKGKNKIDELALHIEDEVNEVGITSNFAFAVTRTDRVYMFCLVPTS